jgi:hypothetical protein
MSDEALEVLARGTQGVPRLLGRAGHLALSLAHEVESTQVDAEVAMETLAMLGLDLPDAESETGPRQESVAAVAPCDEELLQAPPAGRDDALSVAESREPGRLRRLFAAPRRTG